VRRGGRWCKQNWTHMNRKLNSCSISLTPYTMRLSTKFLCCGSLWMFNFSYMCSIILFSYIYSAPNRSSFTISNRPRSLPFPKIALLARKLLYQSEEAVGKVAIFFQQGRFTENMENNIFTWRHAGKFYLSQMDRFLRADRSAGERGRLKAAYTKEPDVCR